MSDLHSATVIADIDLLGTVEFPVRKAATTGLLRGTFAKLGTYLKAALAIVDFKDVDVSTPATNGQALIWDNAAAKWKPGPTGGSWTSGHIPLVADFPTLVNNDGTDLTMSNDTDTGLFLDCGSSGSTDDIRCALKALPAAGANWTLTVRINPLIDSAGAVNGCAMILRESATDKMIVFGQLWGFKVDAYRGTKNAFVAAIATQPHGAQQPWFYRAFYDNAANTITLSESHDGKHFVAVAAALLATTPFTTRADQIGLGFTMNVAGKRPGMSCDYWVQSW